MIDSDVWEDSVTDSASGAPAPDPATATVRLGTRVWSLRPGDELGFGRGADREVRIGHDPVDDFVSRDAGSLTALADGLLVHNRSSTQPIFLMPLPGPEQRIGPRAAAATMPYGRCRLVVPGRFGRQYAMHLDTRALIDRAPVAVPHVPVVDASGRRTRSQPSRITDRERRMLVVLCEPVLVLAGRDAVPATYRQVADRLGTTPHTVRTCLDGLRARLSDVDGISGLRRDDDEEQGRDGGTYLDALARWAIDAGIVTTADVPVPPPRART